MFSPDRSPARAAVLAALAALALALPGPARAFGDDDGEAFFRMLSAYMVGESGGYESAATELVRVGTENGDAQMLKDATEYAIQARALPLALKSGREWLRLEDSKEANKVVATVLMSLGDARSAGELVAKLASRFGLTPEEYLEISYHARGRDQLERAVVLMRETFPEGSRGAEYHHNLSLLMERSGDEGGALASAREAADASGDPAYELRYAGLLAGSDYGAALARVSAPRAQELLSSEDVFVLLAQVQHSDLAGAALAAMQEAYAGEGAVAEDLYHVARMAIFAGRPEEAEGYVRMAVEQNPGLLEAQFLSAFMEVQAGEKDEAIGRLEEIARELGVSVESVVMRYSYYRTGLLEQESAPNSEIAYDALSYYRAGNVFEELEELGRALASYSRIKESDGYLYFYAQSAVASILMEQGERSRAYGTLSRLRDIYSDPDRRYVGDRDLITEVTLSEAELIEIDQDEAAALQHLENSLAKLDRVRPVLYRIALYAEDRGDLARAERALRQYVELGDDAREGLPDPDGYNALGYLLADKNLKLPEARQLIERALVERPNDPNIIDSLGWVLYRMGELEPALRNLIIAARRSMAAEIHAHLGEVLWVLGDRANANAIWSRALYLHPDNEVLLETVERFKAL